MDNYETFDHIGKLQHSRSDPSATFKNYANRYIIEIFSSHFNQEDLDYRTVFQNSYYHYRPTVTKRLNISKRAFTSSADVSIMLHGVLELLQNYWKPFILIPRITTNRPIRFMSHMKPDGLSFDSTGGDEHYYYYNHTLLARGKN